VGFDRRLALYVLRVAQTVLATDCFSSSAAGYAWKYAKRDRDYLKLGFRPKLSLKLSLTRKIHTKF